MNLKHDCHVFLTYLLSFLQTGKKGAEWDEESGNESDLDLTKVVKPIREYIYDRDEMTKQMFKALGNKKIKTMLPDILKVCDNY